MLMEKMMPAKKGCPFNCPLCGPAPEYKESDCPKTREWLARSVHLDIPPQLTDRDCDQIAEGIHKVASVLL
jgi:dTDP-4-amino-4,6-dideoxygalactose transaminase